VNRRCCERS